MNSKIQIQNDKSKDIGTKIKNNFAGGIVIDNSFNTSIMLRGTRSTANTGVLESMALYKVTFVNVA